MVEKHVVKNCIWCRESIQGDALVCRSCGRDQNRWFTTVGRWGPVLALIALLGSAFSWYSAHQEASRAQDAMAISEAAAERIKIVSDRLNSMVEVVEWGDWLAMYDRARISTMIAGLNCSRAAASDPVLHDACEGSLDIAFGDVWLLIDGTGESDERRIRSACISTMMIEVLVRELECTECKANRDRKKILEFAKTNTCFERVDLVGGEAEG